jgi:hypothetical protein
MIRRLAPDQLGGRVEPEEPRVRAGAMTACGRYDGRVCLETGESRNASGGKLPF